MGQKIQRFLLERSYWLSVLYLLSLALAMVAEQPTSKAGYGVLAPLRERGLVDGYAGLLLIDALILAWQGRRQWVWLIGQTVPFFYLTLAIYRVFDTGALSSLHQTFWAFWGIQLLHFLGDGKEER